MPSLIYIFIFDLLLLKLFFYFFGKKTWKCVLFFYTPYKP